MVELEARLKLETGIATLKVRFTRVFGWYIEVSRGQSGRVPESYRRKQTVATGERYSTTELDELADRIAHAEELHRERELSLLTELAAQAARESERVKALAREIARWDVAASMAHTAHRYDYTRPTVDASDQIVIRDGRHPVVERLAAQGRFVPNDVDLDLERERLWLITGPNMAGKSTLLRQVALSVILAQMGSFVPARSARIGVVDRVLSRVGASDNLAGGESTFMVEMRETAEILRNATRRSLVILDEIGRGTSTFDGLSIAWAVAEYLDEAICCRALFATHYHELTALGEGSRHAANYSVTAREQNGDVVFLHRLVAGAASRSYGIAVAKLAGLPETVLARARALLATLEGGGVALDVPKVRGKSRANTDQLPLFGERSPETRGQSEVLETLRALDLDSRDGPRGIAVSGAAQAKAVSEQRTEPTCSYSSWSHRLRKIHDWQAACRASRSNFPRRGRLPPAEKSRENGSRYCARRRRSLALARAIGRARRLLGEPGRRGFGLFSAQASLSRRAARAGSRRRTWYTSRCLAPKRSDDSKCGAASTRSCATSRASWTGSIEISNRRLLRSVCPRNSAPAKSSSKPPSTSRAASSMASRRFWLGRRGRSAVLRPRVPRVATHQFTANARVVP